jgi:hypothetical protein
MMRNGHSGITLKIKFWPFFETNKNIGDKGGESDGYCRETPTRRIFMLLPMEGAGSAAF